MSAENLPLIIVNNVAAKARRAWPLIRAKLEQSAINFACVETTGPGDATTETRDALQAGCRTIAVVGGDGTLSEAAEGFFAFDQEQVEELPSPINPEAMLAILPAGTGDDFARGLIGCRAPLTKWIETFISYCKEPGAKNTRLVDLLYGICDDHTRPFICLNASTMGIGGQTAARVAAQGSVMRSLSGEARFMVAAIGALAAWRERRVRVSVDENTVIECLMNLVGVANGLYAGGGMMLSPNAQIDDGKLDVVAACGLTRAAVSRELLRIHSGGHVGNPKVRITQGTRVIVETFTPEDVLLIEADGNVRGRTPVEFRVMPAALRFVV
jgi:diacylglycerol kinase (ATP)